MRIAARRTVHCVGRGRALNYATLKVRIGLTRTGRSGLDGLIQFLDRRFL